MDQLKKELNGSFENFNSNWKQELDRIADNLANQNDKFFPSYARVATLQAWRTLFLASHLQAECLQFFLEAQNDALTSHIFARLGAWRSALKALRSCIENIYFCLYYKDHPVELELWKTGKHRISFADLQKYFESHPIVGAQNPSVSCLRSIKEEYSTLSKAVHGSAESFRMTTGTDSTVIWTDKLASLGKWLAREKVTLCSLNLLLLVMFQSHLSGAALPGLRKSISAIFDAPKRKKIREAIAVNLPSK